MTGHSGPAGWTVTDAKARFPCLKSILHRSKYGGVILLHDLDLE